jgi:hypothetical protein
MKTDQPHGFIATLIKKCFTAYETKDRDALEELLSTTFTFTSPYDDHITKTIYFQRCWSFSKEEPVYTFERIFEQGNEAFVLYTCTTKSGKKFMNTELFRVDGDKLASVEVFFGNTLEEGNTDEPQ